MAASPTMAACVAADNPFGVAASCTGLCVYDPGTFTLTCDASLVCPVGDSVHGGIVSPPTVTMSGVAKCSTGASWCCAVSDPDKEIEKVVYRGTEGDDEVGFAVCAGGFSRFVLPPGPGTSICSGGSMFLVGYGDGLVGEAQGGPGHDYVLGTKYSSVQDVLYGHGGADFMHGFDGDDIIYGGANPGPSPGFGCSPYGTCDWLFGDEGNDKLYGQAGRDELYGGDGDDELHGGDGDDWKVVGGPGDDRLFGGPGDDVLDGYEGSDLLVGGDGWDILSGGDDDDIICDGVDGDRLRGQGGDDFLWYDDTVGAPADGLSDADGSGIAGTSDTCSLSIVQGCDVFISVAPPPPECTP